MLGAVLVGLVIGYAAGRAVQAAEAREEVEGGSLLIFAVVLGVAALGVARVLHTDAILAVLLTGLAYNGVIGDESRASEQELDDALTRYLVLPLFFLLGVEVPWRDWLDLGWLAFAFAVAVLLLRRLPVVLALRPALNMPWRDVVFLGWFGPVGVSALFYLAYSAEEGARDPRLWTAGSLVVVLSTVAHGVTATEGDVLGYRRHPQAVLGEALQHPPGNLVLDLPGGADGHHEPGGEFHPVRCGADEYPGFHLRLGHRVAVTHLVDRLSRLSRVRDRLGLLAEDAFRQAPVRLVGDGQGEFLPQVVQDGAAVVDGGGEHEPVRQGYHPAGVLAAPDPGFGVGGGTAFQDPGAQRSDVQDVSAYAAHLDAVADPELPADEDADPSGEGADDLLQRQGETGGEQAEHHTDPAGEGSPQQRQGEQQCRGGEVVDRLADVVAVAGVLHPVRRQAPGDDGDDHRQHDQDDGADKAAAGGPGVPDRLQNPVHAPRLRHVTGSHPDTVSPPIKQAAEAVRAARE
ncbi:hypothetical protein C1I99_24850 [Micromonospora deserti]|uniref:Cation/H+ exchanger transmembrane domain-containing protein n=1 Tax=Micromonospora deserti TaxID=2070366 RepID=A0A2W2CNZ1_9ACTN|nr:hypothetical protein C1I99_24850 [Micromonospora deserti]